MILNIFKNRKKYSMLAYFWQVHYVLMLLTWICLSQIHYNSSSLSSIMAAAKQHNIHRCMSSSYDKWFTKVLTYHSKQYVT